MEPENPNPNPNPNAVSFDSPHPVYAMSFSPSSSSPLLALGSFIESPTNRVDLVSFDPQTETLSLSITFDHPYPASKLLFHPTSPSLLASSSDFLRIYQLSPSSASAELRSVLNNSKSSDLSAPLTSFDWNPFDPRRIATSSIDTTCTIWDLDRSSVETQLIAHDKEVYDIAWGEARVFASVSADASVRIFDLRDKEHSTIVYEGDTPLLRLSWNRNDLRYMATIQMDSEKIVILDIRSPAVPVAELRRHRGSVNAIGWGPVGGRSICSAGDDGQALIWELPAGVGGGVGTVGEEGLDPVLGYVAGSEINQLQWSAAHPDWIGIAFANKVQLLRV